MPQESQTAPDQTLPETPAPKQGALKTWLPLVVTVLLMPAMAYAMTEFVLIPRLQHSLGLTAKGLGAGEAAGKEKEPAVRETVALTKLLVNVAGTMGGRYLLVSLSVAGKGASFKSKMQSHDPQLRDLACGTLATKTLADLEKPGARNLIRSELIAGFNNLLGAAMVEEIYLTEFAVQ